MKKCMVATFLLLIAIGFLFPVSGMCQDMSNAEIMKELKALKERIIKLEEELAKKDTEMESMKQDIHKAHIAGHPEVRPPIPGEEPEREKWYDRIELSGAIEVEFGNVHEDFKDNTVAGLPSDKVQEHDLTLATVELGVDAQINKYTRGHILFLYEEDADGDRVRLDEGTIFLGGIEETYGFYLLAGKYYPHFGELNTFLVSDPLTLEIFEIRESAAQAGWGNDWFSIGAGLFNGDVQEDFHRENNRINGFFADVNMHNPEDTLGGVSLLMGLSYLSSVADSNTLEGEVNDINGDGDINDISDYVDGVAAYLVAEYGQFSFGAEYITALDDFRAGEMAYAVDRLGTARDTRPAAWNFEFAYRPIDNVQLAIRYEGSDEMYDLFPEDQYGFAVSWELFKYTTLSAEYLHGEYEDNATTVDRDQDIFTMQLAIEF
ncbi:MAG: LbtU family siderophore porin [Deltaproteobacteria bacterium]|nr:LbtU family siderophore porin [Deltaproteobacteria bacterium]